MIQRNTREAKSEGKDRQKAELRLRMARDEFDDWSGKSRIDGTRQRKNIEIIAEADDFIEFTYRKERWQLLEDDVWNFFFAAWKDTDHRLCRGDVVLNYDGVATQQIDGLYVDESYVFVVECKYRSIRKGKPAPNSDIVDDVNRWGGKWSAIASRLKTEFPDRKPIFLLVTRGVLIDDKLTKSLERMNGVLVQKSEIEALHKMIGEFGPSSASVIMKQELLKSSQWKVFDDVDQTFYASKTEMEPGIPVYHFFANSGDLLPLCNVPRRMPANGGDLAQAYQRILDGSKVKKIKKYLSSSNSFFPNSIVLAAEEDLSWRKTEGDDVTEIGKLSMASEYGSLFVIDGQHRLFGTEASDSGKPVSVCVVENMTKPAQASLFKSINQEQRKVSGDLLWDLYGEFGSLEPLPDPKDTARENEVIQWLVSNILKKINSSPSHSLSSAMKIPSHVFEPGVTFLGFADPMCKWLKNKRLWKPGYLRPESGWKGSENFARNRVTIFYESLLENLSEQWEKPSKKGSKNLLKTGYAFAVINMVFVSMVEFYGGLPRYRSKWNGKQYKSLIHDFTEDLAAAILDPQAGFDRGKAAILDAANDALRKKFAVDLLVSLLVSLRSSHDKYTELAPGVNPEEGVEPSAAVKSRVESVERNVRALIYDTYSHYFGISWKAKIPGSIQEALSRHCSEQRMLGESIDENSLEYLSGANVSDYLALFKNKNLPYFFFGEGGSPGSLGHEYEYFKPYFDDYRLLRNVCSHHRKYPSNNTKHRWLSALDYIEKSITKSRYELNSIIQEEE